jgi:enterochelin esterase-like enzyme
VRQRRSSIALVFLCFAGTAIGQQPATSKPSLPDDQYPLGADSQPQVGVPEGKMMEFTLADSKTFPGFEHKWWLYIPAQYREHKPAALMVFQDGQWYANRDGVWRAPVVLDNLIARKELPVMAAVFINPGVSIGKDEAGKSIIDNRSVEYDTLSAAYATFLLEEILPEIRKHIEITDDPNGRGITGCSSGGICAFTVAWQRPDQFRKVLSFSGSFTNMRGGNVYPSLIGKSDKKPIRIFQQDGTNDLVISGWGSWLEANKAVAAALDQKGYDHQLVLKPDAHCGMHGPSIFPEAMRWLWRDYPR